MAIQGFNKSFYLNAKLAQLQSNSETAADWAGKDAAFLEARFAAVGLTAEQHYEQYGYQEGLAPNAFFNPAEYIRAKATAMFNDANNSYLTIEAAAQDFVNLWGGNVYNHYLQYGEAEGVNPSNAFDVSGYYEAKLAQLQAAGNTEITTVAQVKASLDAAGLTALEHFIAYGQGEGITAPAVPEGEQVNVDTSVPGETFTLTAGVDTLTGTDNNDTFNATITGTAATTTLNSFDKISGGAGTDTLNVSASAAGNFAVPPAVTISGIEQVNVSQAASGGTGTGALTVTNTTFGTGVQKFNYTDASAAADMTAAAVSVTLNSATDVSVASKGTGTFTTVAVTDKSTTASERGATLKNVTIEKASGAATLHGNAIETVNLNSVTGLTTVNAAAGTRAVTVNASGTTTQGGLTDAEATNATLNVTGAQTFGTLSVAKATEVSVNANAATTATVSAAAAKALNIGGTNLLTLTANAAALETVNVSGAGGVSVDLSAITTLTSVDTTGSTAVAPATGALTGANTISIGTQASYVGGAGQDVVTVGATTKAVNLGGGNDTANVTVTALGTGGSINGGDGVNTLKLSNADAVTLSSAGAAQTAFKAAVTNFTTLDITNMAASTISLDGAGSFNKVVMNTAAVTQTFSGVASGDTIRMNHNGTAPTGVTTNALTATNDVLNFELAGNLSGGVLAFGTLTTPGAERVNLSMVDTNSTFAAQLATATIDDAQAQVITVSGNNGVALTHTGTALNTLDASGLTKGAITFTSGALTTNATVTGTATGNDTLDFTSALGTVTLTAAGGNNQLTGSSSAANTITGGTGNDQIKGGSAADTIVAGAGNDTIIASAGKDTITLGAGNDAVDYNAGAESFVGGTFAERIASVDVINDFANGTNKLNFVDFAGGTTLVAQATVQNAVGSAATLEAAFTAAANAVGQGNVGAFQFGGNTYVLAQETTGAATVGAEDLVVELSGLQTLTADNFVLV